MLWNSFLLAIREIRRNALRSFLTLLGIVIGVAAVITMVTLGSGATAQVSQQIAALGSNVLTVRPGQFFGPGRSVRTAPFDLEDAEAIARDVPAVQMVAPTASEGVTAVRGNENWFTVCYGVENEYFEVANLSFETGRSFDSAELRSGKAVCIIGPTVRSELFGDQPAIGQKIRLKKVSCQVIGVLQSKGQSFMGMDQNDVIVVPLRTLQRRIAGNQDINHIFVAAREGARSADVQHGIQQVLRERRHLGESEADDFMIMDPQELAETVTGTTRILTALLGAVAAVSLLVGGIGIMNIMLVSVTERTREIGVRLAIGALEREVLLQFLVEAVVLSAFGGVVGILLGLSASAVLARMLDVPFVLEAGIVLIAFFFSTFVGIVFGYFPARKAARLDPIDALRHE